MYRWERERLRRRPRAPASFVPAGECKESTGFRKCARAQDEKRMRGAGRGREGWRRDWRIGGENNSRVSLHSTLHSAVVSLTGDVFNCGDKRDTLIACFVMLSTHLLRAAFPWRNKRVNGGIKNHERRRESGAISSVKLARRVGNFFFFKNIWNFAQMSSYDGDNETILLLLVCGRKTILGVNIFLQSF